MQALISDLLFCHVYWENYNSTEPSGEMLSKITARMQGEILLISHNNQLNVSGPSEIYTAACSFLAMACNSSAFSFQSTYSTHTHNFFIDEISAGYKKAWYSMTDPWYASLCTFEIERFLVNKHPLCVDHLIVFSDTNKIVVISFYHF